MEISYYVKSHLIDYSNNLYLHTYYIYLHLLIFLVNVLDFDSWIVMALFVLSLYTMITFSVVMHIIFTRIYHLVYIL